MPEAQIATRTFKVKSRLDLPMLVMLVMCTIGVTPWMFLTAIQHEYLWMLLPVPLLGMMYGIIIPRLRILVHEATVSPEGIVLKTTFKTHQYAWSEINDIELDFRSKYGTYKRWLNLNVRTKDAVFAIPFMIEDADTLLENIETAVGKKLERDPKEWEKQRRLKG
ncbi:MAG: hypothetical protein U0105_13315 [Candidatus Obscuribacterales bacterium]|jgi:hypothetical protein